MEEISYRKGTLNDLTAIKELTLITYGQFGNVLSAENVKAWEEDLQKDETYLDLFRIAKCFVATFNNKIAGTAFLIPHGNPYKWFIDEWCYIRLVGVLPEFGGRGIGRNLTELCIEFANATGEKTIALHTSEFQHAARHIYESIGFEKQSQFELFEKKYWLYTLPLDNTSENNKEKKYANISNREGVDSIRDALRIVM